MIINDSSVEKLCEVNSSFDAGVLKVAYVGKNRNGSSISKEAFERSLIQVVYAPLVRANDIAILPDMTIPAGYVQTWWGGDTGLFIVDDCVPSKDFLAYYYGKWDTDVTKENEPPNISEDALMSVLNGGGFNAVS